MDMTGRETSEHRNEPRPALGLTIQVSGIDIGGKAFAQDAHASNISLSGALLSLLETELRTGDVVALVYAGKKARYRIVWFRDGGAERKFQAVVHRLDSDECPWKNLLSEEPEIVSSPDAAKSRAALPATPAE
jgi:hypothetical protein